VNAAFLFERIALEEEKWLFILFSFKKKVIRKCRHGGAILALSLTSVVTLKTARLKGKGCIEYETSSIFDAINIQRVTFEMPA
jgi:hypothetical protein